MKVRLKMTIFERVEQLETQMNLVNEMLATQQNTILSIEETLDTLIAGVDDSGWINLPLLNGVVIWSDSQVPQYRKIGDIVAIRGAVKNVLADGTVIGKLPSGYRPNKTTYFVQNTSYGAGWEAATMVRWKISSNGDIEVERISMDAEYGASKWFPIMNMFPLK